MFDNTSHIRIIEAFHELKGMRFGDLLVNMSPGEFMAIGAISTHAFNNEDRSVRVAELSDKLKVSVPAVSRILKNLEDKGFVERITDKACRRNTYVNITEAGNNTFKKNEEIIQDYMQRVLTHFTDEEIETLILLQKKFIKASVEELKVKEESD